MQEFTSFWNGLMDIGVFVELAFILVCIYVLALPKDRFSKAVSGFLNTYILGIGFLVTFGGLVGSLVYSNVIGYEPCLLCWYARILIYPQALMFGMALFKKDRNILPYATALTVLGVILTLYHTVITIVGESPLPCSATGASCLTRYVYDFGFISIPFMGLAALTALLFAIIVAKKASKATVLQVA